MLHKEIERYAKISVLNPLLLQNYQTLSQNVPEGARQIAAFLKIPLSDKVVNEIASEFSIENQRKRMAIYNVTRRARLIQVINSAFRTLNPSKRRGNGLIINRDPVSGLHWNHIASSPGETPKLNKAQIDVVDRLIANAGITLPAN